MFPSHRPSWLVLLSICLLMSACLSFDNDDDDASSDDDDTAAVIDQDGDGVAEELDCDDLDSSVGAIADDADCDGTPTAEDCDDDDPASFVVAEDGDCDGVLTQDDCDDGDATSTVIVEDADCDGTVAAADCDDHDDLSTTRATDGDCDGVLTEDDCNDSSSLSNVVAEDGDCDGVLTEDDCDDLDAGSTVVADDGDCDGAETLDDCDDDDDLLGAVALDGDCDGVLTELDNCPADANPAQDDEDGDLWGDLCDPYVDLVEFAVGRYDNLFDIANQDCITAGFCLARDPMMLGPYNSVSETWHSFETSPEGSEWGAGYAGQSDTSGTWSEALEDRLGSNMTYNPLTFRVVAEDEHYNLLVTQWSRSMASLPAYSYVRSRAIPFSKAANADPSERVNQDCITPGVCITRGNNQGIYNAVTQSSYSGGGPDGTEWALGATADVELSSYDTWSAALGNNPGSAVDQVMSLHIVGTDLYFDVVFMSFAGGNTGGAFRYMRARALVAGCDDPSASNYGPRVTIDNGYCGDWVRFDKPAYADPGSPANQDCITSAVCITRDNTQGPYNAVTENAYDDGSGTVSPADTLWARGLTSAVAAADYDSWEVNFAPPGGSVGDPFSLHLVSDDLYLDFVALRWGGNDTGGAMTYLRRPAQCTLDHTSNLVVDDADCDGVLTAADCDDDDPLRYPGSPELCDSIDNDCDGLVPFDELFDGDGDQFVACDDCDDTDSAIYPGGLEVCDGIDGDCLGLAELLVEGPLPTTWNSAGSDRYRGTVWRVDSELQVARIEARLDIPVGSQITWMVWTAGALGGPYSLFESNQTTTSTAGDLFHSSGPFAMPPFGVGTYVAVVAHWSSLATYYYAAADLSNNPFPSGPATLVAGAAAGSTGSPPQSLVVSANISFYEVRIVTPSEEDSDADGYPACGECDDQDPALYPTGSEDPNLECHDGIDNDCDGLPDWYDSDCQFTIPPIGGPGGGVIN
jgi:hypothetical protein